MWKWLRYKEKLFFSTLWVGVIFLPKTATAIQLAEACRKPQVNPGGCASEPLPKQAGCFAACNPAQQACQQASSACAGAGANDNGLANKASDAVNGIGDSSTGNQGAGGATQASNAAAMCAAQNANNARVANGAPIPGAYQACSQAADSCKAQCKGCQAEQAKQQADDAARKAQQANSERAGEAAQQGQRCQQSNANNDKMPSLQPPQPPPGGGDKSPASSPYDTKLGENSDPKLDDPKESVKIDKMELGDGGQNGMIDVQPASQPSLISGTSPRGVGSGAGSYTPREGSPLGNSSPFGKGMGGDGKNSGGGFGSFGGNSSLAKSNIGIAPADIKPESGGQYEVSSGSGKSFLGLKGKSDADDTESMVAPPQKPSPSTKDDRSGSRTPALAAAGSSQSSPGALDGTSIFKMVHERYRNLRELGEI